MGVKGWTISFRKTRANWPPAERMEVINYSGTSVSEGTTSKRFGEEGRKRANVVGCLAGTSRENTGRRWNREKDKW